MPRGKKKSASGNRTTSKRAVNCGTRAQREQPTDGTPQVPTRKHSRQTQNQEVSENTGAAESQLLLRREGSGKEPMPAPRDSDNSEPLTRSDIISLIQETVKSLERSNSGATTRVSEPRWNSSDNPSSTSTDNAPRHPTTAVSGQRTACTGVAGSSIETTTQPGMFTLCATTRIAMYIFARIAKCILIADIISQPLPSHPTHYSQVGSSA